MIAVHHLADALVDLADTLVQDFELVDLFATLTDRAQTVSGAAACGLVLADPQGSLQFMAASDNGGRFLELFQLQESEGPCRDAFLTGVPVVNRDLGSAEDVWPTFAPAARAAGYRSVHAFPMKLRDQTIGALNLFGRDAIEFAPDEVRAVQSMANIATIAILQRAALSGAELVAQQLQAALSSRVLIEQAKGFVARSDGISPEDAFTLLRHRARSTGRRLVDVAGEALDDRPAPDRRTPPRAVPRPPGGSATAPRGSDGPPADPHGS